MTAAVTAEAVGTDTTSKMTRLLAKTAIETRKSAYASSPEPCCENLDTLKQRDGNGEDEGSDD